MKHVFCDAAVSLYRDIVVIGFVVFEDGLCIDEQTKELLDCPDNSVAEYEAVKFAKDKHSDAIIFSDLNSERIKQLGAIWISRDSNSAHAVVYREFRRLRALKGYKLKRSRR